MKNKFSLSLVVFLSLISQKVFAQDTAFAEQSLASFRTANLAEIERVHCPAYASNPADAQAAFGCFFVRVAQFFESRPVTNTLALLGEPAIHVQRDVLDPANSGALCTTLAGSGDSHYFSRFPLLPFNNYHFRHTSPGAFGREILVRLRNRGGDSFNILRGYLFNMDGLLTQLIDLLTVVKNTPDFSFTIPREICPVSSGMQDVVVRNIDVEGFYAVLGSVKIFTKLVTSYSTGLLPGWFVRADGSIDAARFVQNANGVRPRRMKFLERLRGTQDRSSLQPLLQSTLDSFILLVDSVHSPADSYIFGHLLNQSPYHAFIRNLEVYAHDLRDSLDHPDVFWPMTRSGNENIQINLSAFLRSLPNPADITSSDPFVLGGRSTPPRRSDRLYIRFVPQFFRDLFANFARF